MKNYKVAAGEKRDGELHVGVGDRVSVAATGTIDAFVRPGMYGYGIFRGLEDAGRADEGTRIINKGLVEGPAGAIMLLGDHPDVIINRGTLQQRAGAAAAVDCGDGDDIVRNSGRIEGALRLGAGNDILRNTGSIDGVIDGGSGDDLITGDPRGSLIVGGAGRDTLIGAAGSDTFRYFSIEESSADRRLSDHIKNFDMARDRIMLIDIDADTNTAGSQRFHTIADTAFSGTAGELRVEALGKRTVVSGDIDGDAVADFSILLDGQIDPAAVQFII